MRQGKSPPSPSGAELLLLDAAAGVRWRGSLCVTPSHVLAWPRLQWDHQEGLVCSGQRSPASRQLRCRGR